MEQILSKDNKNIKEYKKVVSSKSYRNKSGLFAIESVKLVLEALNSGVTIQKVFVTNQFIINQAVALQKLFDKDCVIYEISDLIENKLTQTQNSGGVFAICKKLDNQIQTDKIDINGKCLYLAELQDSGNMGTIIRTAEAMGISGLILSKGSCDLYSLKVLRASMGSAFRLPIFIGREPVEDIRWLGEKFVTYAAVVHETADSVLETKFSENSMVVIGNEGNGLSEDMIRACQKTITIKMQGNAESLNAGMAAGILMWELVRQS